MVDETQGSGAGSGAIEPVVEDNGPWFLVFILTFAFLFASAFAFLVHSLLVTFGPGISGGSP